MEFLYSGYIYIYISLYLLCNQFEVFQIVSVLLIELTIVRESRSSHVVVLGTHFLLFVLTDCLF